MTTYTVVEVNEYSESVEIVNIDSSKWKVIYLKYFTQKNEDSSNYDESWLDEECEMLEEMDDSYTIGVSDFCRLRNSTLVIVKGEVLGS